MGEALRFLETLSAIPGVSGDEARVRAEIIRQIQDFCTYKVDALGNLICDYKGRKPAQTKVMLCAHMDEVGFIITGAGDDGLLYFRSVGGIDDRVVLGKSVLIGENKVYGVIGAKATHQLKENEKNEPIPVEKLYIDIGAADRQDALRAVNPGDRAVFYAEFTRLAGNRMMGRAFDDRAGCALLISLLQKQPEYDCTFVFTVQEEIGCIGAITAGYAVSPEISIVVDATTASDIAGVEPKMTVCGLGRGAVVSFMDKGAVYDRGLYRLALQTAQDNGIPCQVKSGVFGGNDARSIQTARDGARVIAVSLPCRYIHTGSNVLDETDMEHTEKLLQKFLTNLCEGAAGQPTLRQPQ